MRLARERRRLALKILSPLLVLLSLPTLPAVIEADTATFTGIGYLPGGGSQSMVLDVSSDGSTVVGRGLTSADPDSFEAVRWTALDGLMSLGDGGMGLERTMASGVSSDGSVIVGRARMPGSSFSLPFRWTASTGMEILVDTTATMTRGIAYDVSDDGTVVVGVGSSPSPNQAFRWEESSGMVGLGWLPAVIQDSFAFGVSADGSTVCGISFSGGGADVEPFFWTLLDGMVGIGDVPGGVFYAIAYAISGDGTTLIGQARTSFDVDELFIWSEEAGFTLPDSLHGATFASGGWSVNHDGSVVVGFNGSGAMMWDDVHGMRNVQTVLTEEYGLDLTGWTLDSARGVSAEGTVIAGNGMNPDGNPEGWIATLPSHPTGVEAPPARVARLHPPRPNPFNPSTRIRFDLKVSSRVVLSICSVSGRHVRTLVDEQKMAGSYESEWNGCDDRGVPVASGVYFYRLQVGSFSDTKKMVLIQ
jgi:probable HAF family extracellular repeat protein